MKLFVPKSFQIELSSILKVLIGILFVVTIIDPKNLIFHLKYPVFGLVFIVWIFKIIKTKIVIPALLFYVLIFVGIFMPFYALAIGIINGNLNNSELESIVYFNSFFFFLLLLIIVNARIELTKYINYSALIIAGITLSFYVVLLINLRLFNVIYQYFVIEKEVAVYAFRNYGDFTLLMMFYKTSPILVFPLSYYLHRIIIIPKKKRIILDSLILFSIIITLFLSGTRANVFSMLVIIIFYFGFYIYKISKKGFALIILLSFLVSLFIIPLLFDLLFNQHEVSNIEKLGHVMSYFEQFENHKIMAIFGQGIGGVFFSYGINSLTNATELSYLELIRIWGFPITLVFLSILILPIIMEIRSKKIGHVFIAYLAYLAIAGTNPLLLSSTGMMVLVYVFSEAYNKYYKLSENNVTLTEL